MNSSPSRLLKANGCPDGGFLESVITRARAALSSPLLFISLQLLCASIYFLDFIYWWPVTVGIQVVLSLIGFWVRTWRFAAVLIFVLLLGFNFSWLRLPPRLPAACQNNIDLITGVAKTGSYLLEDEIEIIKSTVWCRGKSVKRPITQVMIDDSTAYRKRFFQPGEVLELKNLRLVSDKKQILVAAPAKGFRYYNLNFQKRVLDRSQFLVYLQSKARYYLDGFPLSALKTFLTADRSDVDSQWRTVFKELGITHLFAISGMHIGILYLGLIFFIRRLISLPSLFIAKGHGLLVGDGICLVFIILFLLMIGAPISAKRAGLMLAWWMLIKHWLHWQPLWFILLSVALLIQIENPAAFGQLSFQLSFLSVAGIIVILPLLPIGKGTDPIGIKVFKNAASTFLVSCWLLLFTLPIVQNISSTISLLAPLNNVLHITFVSFIILPLLLVILVLAVFGFYFGVSPGEFYFYALFNFFSRIWEMLLKGNHTINQLVTVRTEIHWSPGLLLLYWLSLLGIAVLLPNLLGRLWARLRQVI